MRGRPRYRACLESGLKLDINRLARHGFIRPGANTGPVGIKWTDSYFDEEKAFGVITADMSGTYEGWFRIQIGNLDQRIIWLLARVTSAVGNGSLLPLHEPSRDGALDAAWGGEFVVGSDGGGKSPMLRNSWTATIVLIGARLRLIRSCAR